MGACPCFSRPHGTDVLALQQETNITEKHIFNKRGIEFEKTGSNLGLQIKSYLHIFAG